MDLIQDVLHIMPVPVPGLQLAFTTLNLILTAVKQTQAFKQQLQVLASCAETLLKTLETQYRTGQLTEESTFDHLQNLNKLLDDLANFVQRRSSCSFLSLLLMKDNSLVTINAYHSRITAMIQAFQISALVDILSWRREDKLAREADRRVVCSQLERLTKNPRLLAEAIEKSGSPMAMTVTFKRRIDENKGGQEELAFFKRGLQYLLTTSGQPVELKPWYVSRYDVEFGEVLGAGGFGVVYRGSWNQTEVALKVMKNTESIVPRPEAVLREVETWSKLRHPHILQFLGANVLDDEPFIVMPLIANGNIREYINNNPSCDRLKFIKQIAVGLVYLHSKHIIHGDLKGVNILVDDGEKALLCDFSLSRIKADANSRSMGKATSIVGSPHWMAPELFKGEKLRFPCDVYSFAMTMYELFTNEIPLGYLAPCTLREYIVDRKIRPGRPNMDEAPQLSDEAWPIIQLCWEAEPTDRPTADTVCNKLAAISSIYPLTIPSNPLPSLPIHRMPAQSLPLENIQPVSRVDSSSSLKTPSRPVTGNKFQVPQFRLKALPMADSKYRGAVALENPGNVASTVQSSDGKILITGLSNGSCVMWHLITAKKLPQDVERPSDPVTAITFELSTSTYVAGFNSGHVIYHHKSLSDFSSTKTLRGNDKPIICLHVLNIVVMALSIGPQNQDLVIIKWCSSPGSTGDIVDRLPLQGIVPSSCLCAAFSPDGKSLYIGTSGGSLFIYSTSNGQFLHRPFHLSSPSDSVGPNLFGPILPDKKSATAKCRSLCISPDSKKVMVSYSSGEIRLWDIKPGSYSILRNAGAITDSNISSQALPAAFSPDGSYVVYASAINPTMVDIQNIGSKRVLSSIALDDSPMDGIQSLNISPDSKKLIVGFYNSNRIMVYSWDHSYSSHLNFIPSGKSL